MDPAGRVSSASSRIFTTTAIESRDEWDERIDRAHGVLLGLTADLSEKEAHDALTSAVCKDAKTHEEVCIGLTCTILIDPQNAARSYRDLTFVSRDGLTLVLNYLVSLVAERSARLLDSVRAQLLWLLKELMRTNVNGTDNLVWNLMRQIAGGDVSPKNLWLAESLMDLLIDQRAFLDKYPFVVASAVYTYLRLIEDHLNALHASLRQKEVNFCISLLRERFNDCMTIGRDLVRLLHNVARIPEFDLLWKDILHNPKALSPSFTGLTQLMQTRTSRRFLFLRLTPDMEKKMVFLTSSVRFGHQKRYQDWFQRQYLSTGESQSLRCDLIRFIVGVIHPSNEVLCSEIIPRWAVLGWLLTTCTHPVAAANAKMALFYDWLFYDAERDNIMNIEPAILVMYHSMRPHPAITATLLDFLCRIIPNFYPPMASQVRQGILTSLRQILDKRVLPSLSPLMDNPKLDRELLLLVQDSFPEFCTITHNNSPPSLDNIKVEDFKEMDGHHMVVSSGPNDTVTGISSSSILAANEPIEAAFSDEEDPDDIPIAAKMKMKEKALKSNYSTSCSGSPVLALTGPLLEISASISQLEAQFRAHIEVLVTETDSEERCSAIEHLVQAVTQEPPDADQLQLLVHCLNAIFVQDLTLPNDLATTASNEAIEDSISRPLFVLFRCFAEMVDDESPGRVPVTDLLVELHRRQPKTGYLLLYFLRATRASESKYDSYRELCQSRDLQLDHCLLQDLKQCVDDDQVPVLCFMAGDLFHKFSDECRNNSDLIHLYVSNIDADQLYYLLVQCLQTQLVIFSKDPSIVDLLVTSLEWETFEQMAFWELLAAHSIPLQLLLPVLPKLKEKQHKEALTAIMMMIKHERPGNELLKPLLSCTLESFVSALLSHWSLESSNSLAQILANQFNTVLLAGTGSSSLSAATTQSSPGKRKRTTMNSLSAAATGFKTAPQPGSGVDSTLELMLQHMEVLRTCLLANLLNKSGKHGQQQAEIKVFAHESMQVALHQVQQVCNDSQKKRFSDLFSLLDQDDDQDDTNERASKDGGNNRRSSGRGNNKRTSTQNQSTASRRPAASKKATSCVKSESEDESSEEEVVVKQRAAKKRRKAHPVGSDSD